MTRPSVAMLVALFYPSAAPVGQVAVGTRRRVAYAIAASVEDMQSPDVLLAETDRGELVPLRRQEF